MSLPLPVFEIRQSGPFHAPVFTAVSTVRRGADTLSSGEQRERDSAHAERLAAQVLLAKLRPCKPPASRPARRPVEFRGALQERCQALRWPVPVYEVTQDGPPHAPVFQAVARIKRRRGRGSRLLPARATARTLKSRRLPHCWPHWRGEVRRTLAGLSLYVRKYLKNDLL